MLKANAGLNKKSLEQLYPKMQTEANESEKLLDIKYDGPALVLNKISFNRPFSTYFSF